MFRISLYLIIFSLFFSCSDDSTINKDGNSSTLFTLMPNDKTKVHFKNTVQERSDFHALNYAYTYNGGGVSLGDVNNDGLDDIYLTSNQGTNKLYLNKGKFRFEDVTDKANLRDDKGWTTGVTMIDINNDGWMDLYVCKSAFRENSNLRRNKLYVNQGDGTFLEQAGKWGIDDDGFSVQSHFFDYDKDGDLDLFLVNHRDDFINSNDLEKVVHDQDFFPQTSDHLYRNDGRIFTDVTIESGLMNKEFSLSASIGDFNNDGWYDIFVANDFITPDKMYINNRNGTFSNQVNTRLKHITASSMGSDFADINNDFFPELMVLDMSAEDHNRGKQNMFTMNTNVFWKTARNGFHFTYMSNMLNLNNGNGYFTDIAQFSGVSRTDWSWAPLIADFDNDGYKDLFITNGIKRELGNQDFGRFINSKDNNLVKNKSVLELLEYLPSNKLQNYAYRNNRDLTFQKVITEWGFDLPVNSNGAAYGDLDNDGDLDLVMNNLEDEASIYRNNSTNNFIKIKLLGDAKNHNAIGAKVKLYTDSLQQYQELFLSRGFQSSVSPGLCFGLGTEDKIKRIEVVWNDGKVSVEENIASNQTLTIDKNKSTPGTEIVHKSNQNFTRINPKTLGLDFQHLENDFNDYSRQVLLPQEQSKQGPALAVGDVNNDGLEDMYLGGAMDQIGVLYFQNPDGTFGQKQQSAFENDRNHEDDGAHFFDADGDGDLDLYVASGSYELQEDDPLLNDRLYINDGRGNFKKSKGLPRILTSTKAVSSVDFDNDGDLDLLVGGRVVPGKYPLPPRSYVLENKGDKFQDVTAQMAPEFSEVGMVNDILVTDFDNDGQHEFIVVGEWMPITLFHMENGKFHKLPAGPFEGTEGWWNTVSEIDFDRDGDMDYFLGNLGGNNKFHPSKDKPLHIFGNNFEDDLKYDMILSKVYNNKLVPVRGKECSTQQNEFVGEKIRTYKDFANSSLSDIYGNELLDQSYHKEVYEFKSVYIENLGNGEFLVHHLPGMAQFGPTMSFAFADVNKDGNTDVIGVGAILEAEIETVRYDGNTGYVLLGDGKGGLKPYKDISLYNDLNSKHMEIMTIQKSPYLVIANNNMPLSIFKLN